MRLVFVLAVLVIASAAAKAAEFHAATGQLVPGRCHMNSCNWVSFDSVEPVIETKRGSLFHLKAHWFSAEYPDGNYNRSRPKKSDGTGDMYVVCLKSNPALIDKGDAGKWYISPLAPGDKDQIFGANETALAYYYAACHSMIVHDVYAGAAAARALGYPGHVEELPEQSQVSDPAEVMAKP